MPLSILSYTFSPKMQEEGSGSRMNESDEEEEENSIVTHQNSGSSSSSASSSRNAEVEDNQIDAGIYPPTDADDAVDFQQRLQLSLAKVEVARLDATCIQGATKVPDVPHALVLTYGRYISSSAISHIGITSINSNGYIVIIAALI